MCVHSGAWAFGRRGTQPVLTFCPPALLTARLRGLARGRAFARALLRGAALPRRAIGQGLALRVGVEQEVVRVPVVVVRAPGRAVVNDALARVPERLAERAVRCEARRRLFAVGAGLAAVLEV